MQEAKGRRAGKNARSHWRRNNSSSEFEGPKRIMETGVELANIESIARRNQTVNGSAIASDRTTSNVRAKRVWGDSICARRAGSKTPASPEEHAIRLHSELVSDLPLYNQTVILRDNGPLGRRDRRCFLHCNGRQTEDAGTNACRACARGISITRYSQCGSMYRKAIVEADSP